jgi:uncharacterized protein (TIGR03382 family)
MNRSCAAIILALACSCSAPSVTIDDMPAKASKTLCTQMFSCCMADELKDNQQWGPDPLGCEVKLKTMFDAQKNAATAGETKMRVTYNGTKMAECLSAYEKLTCAELKKNADANIAACETAFEPKVAVGGACAQDFECVSGSCRGATPNADGMCQAKAGEGSSCTDADCVKGTYCQTGAASSTCRNRKADGESCVSNGECSTGGCNGRNPDGGMPNTGTCGEKGGPGTTCYATTGCSMAGGVPVILLALAGLMRRRRR